MSRNSFSGRRSVDHVRRSILIERYLGFGFSQTKLKYVLSWKLAETVTAISKTRLHASQGPKLTPVGVAGRCRFS